MSGYRRLTLDERYQISILKDSGFTIRHIAFQMSRSPSSISRELKRNTHKKYIPRTAQKLWRLRRAKVGPRTKLTDDVKIEIDKCLQLSQWSPEQISGELKLRMVVSISHETIYRYVYADYRKGGELYRNLRSCHKHRRAWKATRGWKTGARGPKHLRTPIHLRDPIVEERKRLGDFERDTVLGKNGRLLTIVDRTSRLTRIALLNRVNAFDTHHETLRLLQGEAVHTLTNDHGSEFAMSDVTEKELGAKVYFAEPYCAWQRGTNENTNGLIRQYFPKGHDFSKTTDADVKKVEDLLNNRPRKCLGFKTPNQVHKQKSQVLH